MTAIIVDSISFHYADGARILDTVSFTVAAGDAWAIIGRNGAGKSTLLRCIGGLVRAQSGSVVLGGRPIAAYHPAEIARHIAYVPQAGGRPLPPYTVREFVMLGRFPYQGFFALPSRDDAAMVDGRSN